jgi:outer membrane protein assembly factor BamB
LANPSVSPLPGGSEEQRDFYHHHNGMVYRFDARNGKLIWQTPLSPSNQPNGTSLHVIDGVVYAVCSFDIYALDARNGEQIWHVVNHTEKAHFQSVVDNGRVYLSSLDNTFRVLNAADGSELWHNTTFTTKSGHGFSVRNGHLYTQLNANRGRDYELYTLDGTTGEIRWSVPMPQASLLSKPLVEDGVVSIAAREFLFSLQEQSGEIIWQQVVPNTLLHNPSLANGILYAESPALNNLRLSRTKFDVELPHIVALNACTGHIQWMIGPGYRSLPDHNQRSLPIVDGVLLANYREYKKVEDTSKPDAPVKFQGTGSGGIVGLDAQAGKVVLSYPLQDAIWGTLLHGTLYLLESVDLPQGQGALMAKRAFTLKSFHPATGQLLSSHLLATGESTFHVFGIGNGLFYQRLPAPTTGSSPSNEYSIAAHHLSDGSLAWSYSMPPLS